MILLTGGSGRLGTELQKLRKFELTPTLEKLDITDRGVVRRYLQFYQPSLIVHCAAFTKVELEPEDFLESWETNVDGTYNLAQSGIPMLYISTEYVFDGEKGNYRESDKPHPLNFYATTKLVGEQMALRFNGKVIRLLFKPRPWPFERAYSDQWTSGDYVDVIAKEVNKAIDKFDELPLITHIGTGRKSIYDLARQTGDVGVMSRTEVRAILPKDTSLDTTLWDTIKV
ncbi:MAG: sugar nucleotide-binding protein [Candidatus Berkelbacteria bacterium]|nr:sugar nucleotide-binding protein [Candidatus Berkelbacteria bacterium]